MKHDQKVVHRARNYHGEIMAAIRSRDPETAKRKMAEHIHISMTDSVKYLDLDAARGEIPAGYELPPELLKELDTIEQDAVTARESTSEATPAPAGRKHH